MTMYSSKYKMIIFLNVILPVFVLIILVWIPLYVRFILGIVFCLNGLFDNRERAFKRFIVGQKDIIELVKFGKIILEKKSILFEQILEINLSGAAHVVIIPKKEKGNYKFEDVILVPKTIVKFDEFIQELTRRGEKYGTYYND